MEQEIKHGEENGELAGAGEEEWRRRKRWARVSMEQTRKPPDRKRKEDEGLKQCLAHCSCRGEVSGTGKPWSGPVLGDSPCNQGWKRSCQG